MIEYLIKSMQIPECLSHEVIATDEAPYGIHNGGESVHISSNSAWGWLGWNWHSCTRFLVSDLGIVILY